MRRRRDCRPGKSQTVKLRRADQASEAGFERRSPSKRPLGLRTLAHILVGTVTAAFLAYVPGVTATEDARNVAYSEEHGVQPRKEILWEVLFLLPPLLLALAASLVLSHVPAIGGPWRRFLDPDLHPDVAPHLIGLGSAIFGYLIGGLWVWATRILGTLAFNKEAMEWATCISWPASAR